MATPTPPHPERSSSFAISTPSAPSRNNPISLRIYKALGTTFDDAASREALDIAASFYVAADAPAAGVASGSGGKGKGKDVSASKVGESAEEAGTEDERELFAPRRTLKGVSRAATARKYLKRDVESQLAETSRRFLEAFGDVDQKLTVLRSHMEEMQVRCDQVQAELDQANKGTRHLLERADGLRVQRESAQTRAKIIKLFLSRFTLSTAEQTALSSREIAVGPPVFASLDKLERIRDDTRVLLGGAEGKEQAGIDIMRVTLEQQEQGYNKITRYCQFEVRQYTREGQLEVSETMREAMKRLRSRDELFRETLHILTSTRQSSSLQAFLDALTRGGPNGLPRPIEIHAHDPIRYVGDMLAWVHQTTASEHEFLESLFGVKQRRRMMGQARRFGAATEGAAGASAVGADKGNAEVAPSMGETGGIADGEEHAGEEGKVEPSDEEVEEGLVRECMDKDLEGLGRPLKLRIQQTIKSQEGLIVIYKVTNLLQFYLITMRRTIGERASLCKTIEDIYNETYSTFIEMLDAQGRSLLRFLHPPDATLTPPLALRDTLYNLREIIGVYTTSLVDEADRESDFATVLNKAVSPAVEMCERMGDMRRAHAGQVSGQAGGEGGVAGGKEGGKGLYSQGEWERDVFMINCLGYLQNSLQDYPFTATRIEELESQIDRHVESMTYEHHGRLLDECGLAPVMRTIRTRPAETPLSRIPETSSKSLTSALTTFSSFLSKIDVASSPRLSLLSSAALAEDIHRTALRRIAEAYGEVCQKVLDKKEGYEFAETLLRRGREEVEVALGVRDEVYYE